MRDSQSCCTACASAAPNGWPVGSHAQVLQVNGGPGIVLYFGRTHFPAMVAPAQLAAAGPTRS
jgi:hypothetical protein